MTLPESIAWSTLELKSKRGLVEVFNVVPKLKSTFTHEPDQSESAFLTVTGMLDEDIRRFQRCDQPQRLTVHWNLSRAVFALARVEAKITPWGGFSFFSGLFTKEGFQPFSVGVPANTAQNPLSPPVCEIAIKVRLSAPVQIDHWKINSKSWAY